MIDFDYISHNFIKISNILILNRVIVLYQVVLGTKIVVSTTQMEPILTLLKIERLPPAKMVKNSLTKVC